MTTSILPRDVFFPKTPIVSSAITRTKTRNSTQRVLPLRFQFDDPESAHLTSLFSVDSSRVLDLKVRASVSKLVDGFLSSYYSNKVDSKYSSLATRVRRPRAIQGTFNQSLQCGFAQGSGSQTRSAPKQNFEDFLSIGNETTPAVQVPITSIYKKINVGG